MTTEPPDCEFPDAPEGNFSKNDEKEDPNDDEVLPFDFRPTDGPL